MKKQQNQDKTAERGRFSGKRKTEAVLLLLKGDELNALSREFGVTAAVPSEWRERFLAGAEVSLKSRGPKPADNGVLRLKALAQRHVERIERRMSVVHRTERPTHDEA
ncbi:hypothetical protein [Myxococcus landrumensis]|uniref:Transposase n=1 Tax=Myxococcus landrumensis TaxID=2813577 RepID=A0ABX7MY41_9BACT|nr:hypothetical protein [Myxococcus landrumus]QSQ11211.1 hypothetical protein JY572_22600 [Myxococcus landrumus]